MSRGTVQDKLKWIFSLYDVNCDGVITRDDLGRVIISVYDLLGKSVQPQVDELTYKQHIDRVFKVFNDLSIIPMIITFHFISLETRY